MMESCERRLMFANAWTGVIPECNYDGKLNVDDYGIIDYAIGESDPMAADSRGDVNNDGKINVDDYGILDFYVEDASHVSIWTGPADPTLTGYTTLTPGTYTITADNTVLENFVLQGNIVVSANNVTIQNGVVYGGTTTGNAVGESSNDYTGNTYYRLEIYGGSYTTGIKATNATIMYNEIHDLQADAIRAKGYDWIEGNWIYNVGLNSASHGDMIQQYPDEGEGRGNCVIVNNYFDASGGDSDSILFHMNEDNVIDNNIFRGSSAGDPGDNARVNAENNIYYRHNAFFLDSPYTVTMAADGGILEWTDNIQAEDGSTIADPDDF
jgi:hypothetical protein